MTTAAPFSRSVALPRSPLVIPQGASNGAASHIRRETRADGVIYVTGPDGIAQPVASERIAARVEASVRNLGRS